MNHPRPHPGTSLLTRPSLLFRVREWNDSASWEEFHRLYRRLIYGRARRAGLSHADAEDVAQDVFKRVAETIRDFDTNPERGSFRGWLMKLTHWRIADKFKSRQEFAAPTGGASDQAGGLVALAEDVAAPTAEEDEWDREWQQHVLAAATERLARQVKPQHFQVFDLYVLQNWSLLRVTKELRVSPASVYVIGHRLTKRLKAEVGEIAKTARVTTMRTDSLTVFGWPDPSREWLHGSAMSSALATPDPGEAGKVAAPKPSIPDYELLRVVGRGSYGDVWLARSVTGAWRAIKVVWRDRFANAEPFEREFRGLKEFAEVLPGRIVADDAAACRPQRRGGLLLLRDGAGRRC